MLNSTALWTDLEACSGETGCVLLADWMLAVLCVGCIAGYTAFLLLLGHWQNSRVGRRKVMAMAKISVSRLSFQKTPEQIKQAEADKRLKAVLERVHMLLL